MATIYLEQYLLRQRSISVPSNLFPYKWTIFTPVNFEFSIKCMAKKQTNYHNYCTVMAISILATAKPIFVVTCRFVYVYIRIRLLSFDNKQIITISTPRTLAFYICRFLFAYVWLVKIIANYHIKLCVITNL